MISTNPKLERLVDEFWIPFCEEFGRLRQQRLNAFTGYLAEFLNDLLNYPLVRPWRESLNLFQEHYWQQIGLQLTSESYDTIAAFIERWVNDPRCYAHGPIQPDTRGQPPRRPPGGLVGTPKSKHPLEIPEGEQENMRRFAHHAAELEQKRIDLTDEERSLYEAYIYENIRRQYTGERAIKHPEFWHARNDALNKKNGWDRTRASVAARNPPPSPELDAGREVHYNRDQQTGADSSMVADAIPAAAQKAPATPAESKPLRGPKWLELRVDAVLFPFGSYKTDSFLADITEANKIFENCRIKVILASTRILNEDDTRKAGTIYQPQKGQPPRAILDPEKLAAVAGLKTTGNATVYYVPEVRGGAAGQKISDEAAVVASFGASGRPRQSRVVAHELVHVMGRGHDHLDIHNLMIDINESDLKTLGLEAQWEQFKKQYKGPTKTGIDLQVRFYAFVYDVTRTATRLRPDQCRDMRNSALLHDVK